MWSFVRKICSTRSNQPFALKDVTDEIKKNTEYPMPRKTDASEKYRTYNVLNVCLVFTESDHENKRKVHDLVDIFACRALAASICFGIVIPYTWLSIYILYC